MEPIQHSRGGPSFRERVGRAQAGFQEHDPTTTRDDSLSVSSRSSSRSGREEGQALEGLVSHSQPFPGARLESIGDHPHSSISEETKPKSIPTWTPLSLRRIVLLAYAILFISIIVALEVLNYVSSRDLGLATVSENLYYLWKFGPTFILTIIIAFWAHVEYSAKQMMPWMVMAKSRDTSSRGFTLNYLTQTIPEALFLSAKSGDFPVFFAVVGTVLLRLSVIFSTGLLAAQDQVMTHSETVQVLDAFNFSREFSRKSSPADILVTLWATSNLDLAFPSATTPDFSTQSFLTSNSSHRTTTAFAVEVFEASLVNCTSFSATLPEDPEESVEYVFDILPSNIQELLTPYCMYGYPVLPMKTLPGTWAQDLSRPSIIDVCPNSTSYDPDKDSHALLTTFPFSNPDGSQLLSGSVCHPKYTLRRRTVVVTASGSNETLKLSNDTGTELSIELPPKNLTTDFIEQTNDGFSSYQTDSETRSLSSDWVVPLNWSIPQDNFTRFRDADLAMRAFQKFFRSDLAQLAKAHYVSPSNQTVPGKLTSTYKRLCVGQWSLRLMEALLALMTITTICLCCFNYPSFSRNPESLGAQAGLLARSPQLWSVLRGTGELLMKPFRRFLSNHNYQVSIDRDNGNGPVYTHINSPGRNQNVSDANAELANTDIGPVQVEGRENPRWWRPMASTWWFRILTVIFTIALIIVLEVLYQHSAKNKGIMTFTPNSYQLYGWLYVSTVIMAGTALAYGALDSAARLLHPFQELCRGKMRFRELLYEPLGQATILAIVHSLRKRYLALFIILLTSLVSPTLTIVTSGLFTTTTVQYYSLTPLNIHDWFVVKDRPQRETCNSESQLISKAISFNNLSYPKWTYEGLVFPELSLGASGTNTTSNLTSATSLTATVPSVRSRMNCHLQGFYTPENLTVEYTDSDKTYSILLEPPAGCTGTYPYDNATRSLLHLGGTSTLPTGTGYLGHIVGTSYARGTCSAHMWYIVARLSNKTFEEVTMIDCIPYVEALPTTVNLTLPDLAIDTAVAPPTPHEAADGVRTFADFTSNRVYDCLGQDAPLTYDDGGGAASLDPFFQAIVLGREGVPIAELAGPAGADTLMARAEAVYQRVMAQEYNFNWRIDVANPNASATFAFDMVAAGGRNGTLTTEEERLVQSAVATRILEGVLAAMVVCAGLHFAAAQRTRVVPKDPGSVAARMSLFAGSELVRRIPEDEKELKGAFEGEVVRLGWWDGEEGKRFGIDVGTAARQDV